MRDERGYWYLLTGFVIGIVLGLVYAWLISPQQYKDTSPASLQPEFKDQYRAMIAAAFVATGNLPRAEARLQLLDDQDVVRTLTEQAQLTLAEGSSPRQAQALGLRIMLGCMIETSLGVTAVAHLSGLAEKQQRPVPHQHAVQVLRAAMPSA